MRTTGVAELKATLSDYLARVKAGEEIMITERGRPIAKLVPLDTTSLEEGVQELVRLGLAKPPKKKLDQKFLDEFFAAPRVPDHDGTLIAFLLKTLREDRDGD